MDDKLDTLLAQMRNLEKELIREIQRKEGEFFYKIQKGKVSFTEEANRRHKLLAKRVHRTVLDSKFLILLTTPLIWACLLPIALLDFAIGVFQMICFPVYGIPKVRRAEYIMVDRHQLSYLNPIEKLNCVYCGYANGLFAYVTEVAGRTEQYWCPIKHALRMKFMHSRYAEFLDFGNAEDYRSRIEEVRRRFKDIE